jgi:competence protein ComEC
MVSIFKYEKERPGMIRLRTGYVITGIITGLLLVLSFFTTIPDGKLHIVFCDVGQGDGIYIRFPNGKDMVVDGGPGNKIIGCLSRHMPFWDRIIDIAVLTHPEKDHINGFVSVLERYQITYLMRSDIANNTEGYASFLRLINEKHIDEKRVTTGSRIDIGSTALSVLWPTASQIARMKPVSKLSFESGQSVLGASVTPATTNLNDGSVVIYLSYGTFDVLLPGDADSHVDGELSIQIPNDPDGIEIFKVPHHGSKTGMTDGFLNAVNSRLRQGFGGQARPGLGSYSSPKKSLAVISVGTNSYGHPAPEVIQKLESAGFQVLRTDKIGDIEVVSDGRGWQYTVTKN